MPHTEEILKELFREVQMKLCEMETRLLELNYTVPGSELDNHERKAIRAMRREVLLLLNRMDP